mmetsp:Transcript_24756/g.50233  ORF Transcript_24756/g.50233 Transcript_24756/m.50233 type:complete len:282 (+) Transcript_24756:189-1034(+)|eukprot:CAMPEP_0181289656 /NCGR_PEP_ID=MMETSP1101-20121128/997_1 /TAXON_ID=46948 /ORGANISM="Rhodomonas abbreviata, Strain Caron Lab Isolate" /LENGTH=281 /DNA_ID=CAMNT_0023393889 /DNA_START=183 /DNA_END=1028 /DNA_ORIENTATION=-
MDTEEEEERNKFSRRLRKDRNAGPQVDLVHVSTSTGLPSHAGVGLAQALLKHILFIRQQIPMPYDQLKAEIRMQASQAHEEGGRRRRPNAYIRKASKLVEASEFVLEGLSKLISKTRVLGILISLGPTPINPKQAFILRFDSSGLPSAPEPAKGLKDPSRIMIRQVVTSGLEQFDSQSLPTKTFVMALVAPGIGSPGNTDCLGTEEADWREGWVARHGFSPKLKRCRPVGISVGPDPFCGEEFPTPLTGVGDQQGVSAGMGLVWVQHGSFIRGLPHDASGI